MTRCCDPAKKNSLQKFSLFLSPAFFFFSPSITTTLPLSISRVDLNSCLRDVRVVLFFVCFPLFPYVQNSGEKGAKEWLTSTIVKKRSRGRVFFRLSLSLSFAFSTKPPHFSLLPSFASVVFSRLLLSHTLARFALAIRSQRGSPQRKKWLPSSPSRSDRPSLRGQRRSRLVPLLRRPSPPPPARPLRSPSASSSSRSTPAPSSRPARPSSGLRPRRARPSPGPCRCRRGE